MFTGRTRAALWRRAARSIAAGSCLLLLATVVGGRELADADAADDAPASADVEKAQRDLFQLDLEHLGRVEVAPAKGSLATTPSNVIDLAEVRDTSASTTGELLQQAASVATRRTSALNLDAIVRGYTAQQIGAAANGMSELKTRVDVDSLFSQIDPGIVESITVVDGPYTSLYGPGFAFLIADLFPTTRSPSGLALDGWTTFGYQSNGQNIYARENVRVAGTDYGAIVSYGIRTGNDYVGGGGDDWLVPASHKKWDTFLALSKDVAAGQRVEFNYLRTEINGLELPGVTYDVEHSHNDQFNLRWVAQDDPRGPEWFVLQAWLHDTAYFGDASASAKQRTFFEQFITGPSLAAGDDIVNVVGAGRLDSLGVRSYCTLGDVDDVQTIVGVDFRRYSMRYTELDLNADGSLAWGGNLFGIPGSHQEDVGTFANVRCPLSEFLELTWGGRVDYVQSHVREDDEVITQFGDPASLYYVPGLADSSNMLGMTYLVGKLRASEQLTYSAGVAFAMRAPTLSELYSDEPYVPMLRFGNTFIDGNSELSPEKNVQIDLGLAYRQDRWRYGVRGFFANIEDYILPVPSSITAEDPALALYTLGRDFSSFPAGSRGDLANGTANADQSQAGYRYQNVSRATLWGGDVYVELPLSDTWLLAAALSYVEGTNRDPQQFVADLSTPGGGTVVHLGGTDPLPGIYPFTSTLDLRWYEPEHERYAVDFVARLVGEQERVAVTLSELPTSGFIVCALRGHWQATRNLRLSAGIENLFNADYTQHGSLVIFGPSGLPTFVREPGIGAVLGVELKY